MLRVLFAQEDNMELEMKYALPEKETGDAIWEDELIQRYADPASMEKIVMKAVYFDTEDGRLSKNNMAVRVRSEGGSVFATLKWNGSVSNGFHEREEVNVPAAAEHFISSPKELFSVCEDGRVLLDLIGDEPLINLLEMRYLRSRCRLSYGASIMELAIDTGSIITDKGEVPILELELELYAGDPKDIRDLGARLQEKYALVPEDRSKLARGLSLLRS